MYGVYIGGSRIKGYHTSSSDIDLVLVGSDLLLSDTNTYNKFDLTLRNELGKANIHLSTDYKMAWWLSGEVTSNPDEFIYIVDSKPGDLISIFGSPVYHNPNFKLAQLAALEVINQYKTIPFDWGWIREKYKDDFLGERERCVEKLTERLDTTEEEVERIITPWLFAERYKKFKLPNPQTLLKDLRAWKTRHSRGLYKYEMYDVYQQVLKQL